ncbi:MAG: sigma-70 family RNA polymerase sigma factor [Clostridia bacterium]|nr:sigma-70 family RNA polymerase sigma factor [Clostridia bacterium]MBQ2110261.1 sigma-70 family RNA polymerase sigma factor [Clostridia bacterium]MBQ3938415.1 sigma-70 family RNA polymerase sigma factor [Clostridia bacterium]
MKKKLLAGSELFRRRFLFVCARNRAIDLVKKRSRVTLVGDQQEMDLICPDEELEELLSDNAALKKAMDAVKRLVPPYSNVLYMHLAGWTVAEMADLFGMSSETVRKQLYRAKKQLREAVLNEGDEDQ